ncbi:putative immunity protein [Planococcus sp. APC 3906]|uniref:putative immunity protein n=1 Tax=Planococcus TaxID=1372 RepID=UPI0025B2BEED|nr:hypothetical protein [Planococcus sp. APC 3906]MDN3450463.1 hypothetical protein [Planococcus sp. APC 3906]
MSQHQFTDTTETKEEIEKLLGQIDHQTAVGWAADCAEHVLKSFEELHPQDKRPRKAVQACRDWVAGSINVREARSAAFDTHAAARMSENEAAIAAARAAGQAISTAHLFGHAIHASTYAVKSVAFASGFDAQAIAAERNWQRDRLIELQK